MLLTPYGQLTISDNLCGQNTFDAFVEGLGHLLTLDTCRKIVLIGLFLSSNIA